MKIKELYTDSSKWCKNNYAQDKNGKSIKILDESAVSWCLVGAVCKCYDSDNRFSEICDMIHKELNLMNSCVGFWNDNPLRKFSEVKELVEKLDI